jgi:hypothetical protein
MRLFLIREALRHWDACYDKIPVPTTYLRREKRWPRYIVRAGRHTNCGGSSGGPKGATNGFSSIMKGRAKPMLSRSRTVRRVVGGLSASSCFPDSRTSRACSLRGSGLYTDAGRAFLEPLLGAAFALRPLCIAQDRLWCEYDYPRWVVHTSVTRSQHPLCSAHRRWTTRTSGQMRGYSVPPVSTAAWQQPLRNPELPSTPYMRSSQNTSFHALR